MWEEIRGWLAAGGLDAFGLAVLAFVVVSPLLVLAHELGHAAVGLVGTEGLVRVNVGREPGLVRGRLGRLAFELSPLPSRTAAPGLATTYARLSPARRVVYAAAGPATETVVLVVLLLPVLQRTHGLVHQALVVVWLYGVSRVLFNLVPSTIGERRSDGGLIADTLRSQEHDSRPRERAAGPEAFLREFEATKARWLALITDTGSTSRTERRARVLGGVAVALRLDPERGPGATACLWSFAGWCWREVERGGDRLRIEDGLIAALAEAEQLGLTGDVRLAQAAGIAAGAVDLGLGSPGPSDDERRGFLARAFREVGPVEPPAPLDEQLRWFAFRYGAAVHGLEALNDRR